MQEPVPPFIEFIAAFIEDMEAAAAAAEAELKPALWGDTEDMPPMPTIEFIVYVGAIGLKLPLLLFPLFGPPGPIFPLDSGGPPPPTNPGVLLPLVLFVANEFAETSEYSFCILATAYLLLSHTLTVVYD